MNEWIIYLPSIFEMWYHMVQQFARFLHVKTISIIIRFVVVMSTSIMSTFVAKFKSFQCFTRSQCIDLSCESSGISGIFPESSPSDIWTRVKWIFPASWVANKDGPFSFFQYAHSRLWCRARYSSDALLAQFTSKEKVIFHFCVTFQRVTFWWGDFLLL